VFRAFLIEPIDIADFGAGDMKCIADDFDLAGTLPVLTLLTNSGAKLQAHTLGRVISYQLIVG